jgi:hypothetical protein
MSDSKNKYLIPIIMIPGFKGLCFCPSEHGEKTNSTISRELIISA